MFERVMTSNQNLYKHILKEQLRELALWDAFDISCFERSPGANEIGGNVGVSLGRDEAHERVISLGLAFHHPAHPTEANIEVMTKSAPILSQNHDNLIQQFFPSTKKSQRIPSAAARKEEEKVVQSFLRVLQQNKSLHVQNQRQLIQPGSNEITPREKVESFLNRHKISREIASAIVDQQILKKTNFNREPLKKRVIPALPPIDGKPKKAMPKDNLQKKLISNLLMSNLKQQQGLKIDSLPGVGVSKFSPLLFNQDGSALTIVGKSSFKTLLLKRYGENSFYFDTQTSSSEKAIFIDGMPSLFLAPVMGMRTFKDYCERLLQRKITKYFHESDEVHVLFDCPGIWGFNLKKKVQDERDAKRKKIPELLVEEILDTTLIPCSTSQWPGFLANRENKRKLIMYIGEKLIALKDTLEDGKAIIFGGCTKDGKTYMVEKGHSQVLIGLESNHEEADTRVFAHAKWSNKKVLQVVGADTDIFAICLLNFHHFPGKTVLLDQSDETKILHVNAMVNAMNEDQDTDILVLKQRNDITLPFFYGLIHPLIGSDILCSPRGFGPALILKTCIDFSTFLFSVDKGIQNLKENNNCHDAYCRYVLALFKKRFANKIKMKAEEMFGNPNVTQVLDTVREEVFIQTLENNTVLPSKECLEYRALNLSFQLKIWTQATIAYMTVPDPLSHGWEEVEGALKMIPDSVENQRKQATVYETVMKKCKCKKSQCQNKLCGCFSSKQQCSSFCECQSCKNCPNFHATEAQKDTAESESEGETEEEDASDEEYVDDDVDID